MRLWKAFVVVLVACACAVAVGVLGSSEGRATARTLDSTLSSAPEFGIYGKHISFTIDTTNTSAQRLVHVTFHGTASSLDTNGAPAGTMTYDPTLSTTSPGTSCAVDPNDSLSVNCDYGDLDSGERVVSTFAYTLPTAATGAVTARFSALNGLRTNEGSAGGCNPGSQCVFSPTPSSVSVNLRAETDDLNSDVFGTQGGLLETTVPFKTKTVTNATGTHIGIPATSNVIPASIVEGANDPNVCGTDATSFGPTTTLIVPGAFPGNGLSVALDVLASELPSGANFNNLKLCHNGAVVAATKSKFKNGLGQTVFRLLGAFDSNGQVGGGV